MNKLEIKLRNEYIFNTVVECNGEVVPLIKKDKSGFSATYETEDSLVKVKIYSMPNELLVHNWFLRFLFYYFISILGLFDWGYSNNPYAFCYEAEYNLNGELTLDLKWNTAQDGANVFKTKDNECEFIDNISNIYTYDKRVKNRYRGVLAFKILSWILLVIMVTLIIIFK